MWPLGCLTAVVDGNVSGRGLRRGGFVAAAGLAGDLGGVAESVAEKVDGVALEAEPDVGVHGGGDADVGVPQTTP